jgi:Fusaric acid resistance protein family
MIHFGRLDYRHALRTAIAGTSAMFLAKYLRLPEAYWAAISAIIVLQANLGAAVRDSLVRIGATAVGATVAIPFLAYFGDSLLSFAAAVFITVIICSILKLQSGIRLGATTVAVILLIQHHGAPWSPALHRFLEVSFGIVVALAVANLVFPATATDKMRSSLSSGFELLSGLFLAILDKYRSGDSSGVIELRGRMQKLLRATEDLRAQSKFESTLWSADYEVLDRMLDCQTSMFYQMSTLDSAAKGATENKFYRELLPEIDSLCDGIETTLKRFAAALRKKDATFERFDFRVALAAVSDKNLAVREQRLSQKFALEEVLHFHTLLVGLENLATEAEEAQAVAAAIASRTNRRSKQNSAEASPRAQRT